MRLREFATDLFESTKTVSAEQVWDYVDRIHPVDQQGGGFLKSLIMRNPQYELKRVPLSSIHIPDQEYDDEEQDPEEDPYNRVQTVDPEHAGEYSVNFVDRRPIVVDSQGWIIDGNHRAWAAANLLNKLDIMAWVPVNKLNEISDELRRDYLHHAGRHVDRRLNHMARVRDRLNKGYEIYHADRPAGPKQIVDRFDADTPADARQYYEKFIQDYVSDVDYDLRLRRATGIMEDNEWSIAVNPELEELAQACDNWFAMEYTANDIQQILTSPYSAPYKKPSQGHHTLYRCIFPKDKAAEQVRDTRGFISYATTMRGAEAFRKLTAPNEPYYIIEKQLNPADFILNFTSLYEMVMADMGVNYDSESEVWMKRSPYYVNHNKNEIVSNRRPKKVTEIARIPQGDFGDADTLTIPKYDVDKKELPGGSGFTYAVGRPDAEDLEIMIFDGDTLAAELDLFETQDVTGAWRVSTVAVNPQYRSQGLGKALYGIALSILKLTVEAGDTQTKHGQRMWLMLNSIPGVEVLGYKMERTEKYKPRPGDTIIAQDKDWTRYTFPVKPGINSMRSGRYGTGMYTSQASMIAKWTGK